jgi:hypothetical protein
VPDAAGVYSAIDLSLENRPACAIFVSEMPAHLGLSP